MLCLCSVQVHVQRKLELRTQNRTKASVVEFSKFTTSTIKIVI